MDEIEVFLEKLKAERRREADRPLTPPRSDGMDQAGLDAASAQPAVLSALLTSDDNHVQGYLHGTRKPSGGGDSSDIEMDSSSTLDLPSSPTGYAQHMESDDEGDQTLSERAYVDSIASWDAAERNPLVPLTDEREHRVFVISEEAEKWAKMFGGFVRWKGVAGADDLGELTPAQSQQLQVHVQRGRALIAELADILRPENLAAVDKNNALTLYWFGMRPILALSYGLSLLEL